MVRGAVSVPLAVISDEDRGMKQLQMVPGSLDTARNMGDAGRIPQSVHEELTYEGWTVDSARVRDSMRAQCGSGLT